MFRLQALLAAVLAGAVADAWIDGGVPPPDPYARPEGAAPPTGARLQLVSLEGYTNAVCSDGSPAGYYFRPGFGTGTNVWVVFLEGVRFSGTKNRENNVSPRSAPGMPPAHARHRLSSYCVRFAAPGRVSGAGTRRRARSGSRRSRREWGASRGSSTTALRASSATRRRGHKLLHRRYISTRPCRSRCYRCPPPCFASCARGMRSRRLHPPATVPSRLSVTLSSRIRSNPP